MTQRHIPEEQQPLAQSGGNPKTRNLQLTILPGNLTEVTTPLLGNSEHGCYKIHIGRGEYFAVKAKSLATHWQ
jgi:hypothetical protein